MQKTKSPAQSAVGVDKDVVGVLLPTNRKRENRAEKWLQRIGKKPDQLEFRT